MIQTCIEAINFICNWPSHWRRLQQLQLIGDHLRIRSLLPWMLLSILHSSGGFFSSVVEPWTGGWVWGCLQLNWLQNAVWNILWCHISLNTVCRTVKYVMWLLKMTGRAVLSNWKGRILLLYASACSMHLWAAVSMNSKLSDFQNHDRVVSGLMCGYIARLDRLSSGCRWCSSPS